VPCFYCGVRLRPSGPAMRTKDHVVPKSQGGTKTVEACLKCNAAKADKSLEEFRRIRGGIEFWGEMKARLEAEKTAWIYNFSTEKRTITPSSVPLPMYTATVDLSKVPQYPNGARTKKERNANQNLPNTLPNLRGQKFGAFTVIGWIGEEGRWEVICICGTKEVRTTRAVRNPLNTFDACVECRKPVGKLRSDIFKETGIEVSWEDCFQYVYGPYLGEAGKDKNEVTN
jgi:hypothetical protein